LVPTEECNGPAAPQGWALPTGPPHKKILPLAYPSKLPCACAGGPRIAEGTAPRTPVRARSTPSDATPAGAAPQGQRPRDALVWGRSTPITFTARTALPLPLGATSAVPSPRRSCVDHPRCHGTERGSGRLPTRGEAISGPFASEPGARSPIAPK